MAKRWTKDTCKQESTRPQKKSGVHSPPPVSEHRRWKCDARAHHHATIVNQPPQHQSQTTTVTLALGIGAPLLHTTTARIASGEIFFSSPPVTKPSFRHDLTSGSFRHNPSSVGGYLQLVHVTAFSFDPIRIGVW